MTKVETKYMTKGLRAIFGGEIKRIVVVHDDKLEERKAMIDSVMTHQSNDTAIVILPTNQIKEN